MAIDTIHDAAQGTNADVTGALTANWKASRRRERGRAVSASFALILVDHDGSNLTMCADEKSKGFAARRNAYRRRHTGKRGYMRRAACRIAPSLCILEMCRYRIKPMDVATVAHASSKTKRSMAWQEKGTSVHVGCTLRVHDSIAFALPSGMLAPVGVFTELTSGEYLLHSRRYFPPARNVHERHHHELYLQC